MTKKDIRSRKHYFKILLIYTLVLLAIGFVGLKILWSFASEYENSQIESKLNSYLTELNENRWNDAIAEAAGNLRNSFQDKSEIESVVKDYLSDGTIVAKTGSIGDVMKYNLVLKDNIIGNVSFSENMGAHVRFKMYPWEKVSEEFNFDFLKSTEPFTIEIPETYTLKINGKEVGEEYIAEKHIEYDVLSPYYLDYPDLPYKVRYEVPELVGEIDAKIYNADGEEVTIDANSSDIQFVTPCTDGEITELRNFMEDGFVEAYMKFWGTKWVDETYPTLMQYVMDGSTLQQEMYTYTLDAVTWIHTNSVVINSMNFNYALSLGGGCYVVSETVDSTAYADYKTVNETSDVVVIVMKDPVSGEILAIDRA